MVEAMACGLATVAAETPVNREVLGPAAVYFRTFDSSSCAEAVIRVLKDGTLRESLVRRALPRAEGFRWSSHAESLHDVFGMAQAGARGTGHLNSSTGRRASGESR